MNKKALLLVLAGFLVFASIFTVKYLQMRKSMAMQALMVPPAPSVGTAKAVRETWNSSLHSIASLQSSKGIALSNEVAGVVLAIEFESGAEVAGGAPLLRLDDSTEQAQLAGLEAGLRLAEINLTRAADLRKNGSNTQAEYDAALAARDQAAAGVEQIKALIAKKHIAAPFPGRLGIRLVSPGQYLAAGSPIVQLESLDPIYADFGIPQQDVARLHPGMEVVLSVDSYPGRRFTGRIEAIDPRISGDTRNLRVRARLDNPDRLLRPGMFGSVDIALPETLSVVVIPGTALAHSPYGDYVYLVEKTAQGPVVRQRFVRAGPSRGDQVAITEGLSDGAEVVSVGQMKLRNNLPVRINDSVLPDNNPNPHPAES